MSDQIRKLAADIVTAYVSNREVSRAELSGLIELAYKSLVDAQENRPSGELHSHAHNLVPAVDPKKSVFKDRIVCLEDGREFKTIKRHLQTSHGMTVAEYKLKWGLPAGYPVTAPNYANTRSKLAKEMGLGRKAAD